MKKGNNDQTVMEGNAPINVNINTNEPKKGKGFKRGAVVGTLGGIFLGGAGAAYAIENDITMEDVKDGINDVVKDFNRGVDAAFNNKGEAEVKVKAADVTNNQEAPVEPTEVDNTVNQQEAPTEEQGLSTEEIVDALKDATAEQEAPGEEQGLSTEEIVDALKDATAEQEAPGEEQGLSTEEIVDALKEATAEQDTTTEVGGDEDNLSEETPEITWSIDESVAVAETVSDEMSFDEAFAAARAEVGAGGAFEWRGGLYGTYYAEEWEAMSDAEKDEFGDKFEFTLAEETEDVGEQNLTPLDTPLNELLTEDETTDTTENENLEEVIPEDGVLTEDLGSEDGSEPAVEVDVDNVYNVTDAYGNESSYVEATVGGEEVQLVDVDGDGNVDVLVYDENNDGTISEAEHIDVSQEGLQVDAFVELVEEPTFEEPAFEDVAVDEPLGDEFVADDTMDDIAADDMMA